MAKSVDGTLNPEPNLNVKTDRSDPAVLTAIQLIQNNLSVKNDRDSKNRLIRDLFEKGFTVKEPKGPRKIQSKLIQQVLWRMASRMKPLDFVIHGAGRDRNMEKIVTDGVATVLDRGGYDEGLRDKNGAFINLLLYGDSFMQVGTQEGDMPIKFNVVDNANVYTDTFCTKIRGQWGRKCTQMCVVFSHPWAEIIKMFPEMKDKAGIGKIPRDLSFGTEQDRDTNQTNGAKQGDLTEVAYFYDINDKNYTVFIGNQTTIQKQLKGDDYPFVIDGEPYIPVLQFMCQPSARGFYNHGVGDMIYDLAVVTRQLMNMGVGHAEDNVYPITHVNIPKGEVTNYFNKLSLAHEMRAAGKKGYVAMEYDPQDPNANRVNSESLTTQSLVNEWQLIFDNLTRELSRMGISVDEADRPGQITATQILAEEESQNALIKQIMEWNASESQFAVELTMDMIKQFVGKKNKAKLDLTTMIDFGQGEIRADGITLGMVADELKQHHYFVKINSRTGAIPSNLFRQAQLSKVLPFAQPGTPAYTKLVNQLSQLNDVDIKGEEFGMPQPEMAQGGPAPEPQGVQASGTERQSIRKAAAGEAAF